MALLIRPTRSGMPTEAGRALAARLAPLFANAQGQARVLLRLDVAGAVMVDNLPPLIDQFLAIHPQVRLETVAEDRLVDIVAVGCDAGVRYGEHPAGDTIAVPIGLVFQRLAYARRRLTSSDVAFLCSLRTC